MKKKESVIGLSPKEIMKKYSVSKGTAYRCYHQGWIAPNWLKKEIIPSSLPFSPKEAYKQATGIFFKFFYTYYGKEFKEDAIQEVIVRFLEMAGHPRFIEKSFRCSLAINAMRGFFDKTFNKREVPYESCIFRKRDFKKYSIFIKRKNR